MPFFWLLIDAIILVAILDLSPTLAQTPSLRKIETNHVFVQREGKSVSQTASGGSYLYNLSAAADQGIPI